MLRGSGLYNVHGVYIIGTEGVVSSVCGPMSRHRILIALDRPWARNEHGHLVEKCNYKFLNNPPRLTIELLYKNFSFTRPVNWSPVNAQKSFGPHSTGPLINWSNEMPWSPGPQSKTKWSQGICNIIQWHLLLSSTSSKYCESFGGFSNKKIECFN